MCVSCCALSLHLFYSLFLPNTSSLSLPPSLSTSSIYLFPSYFLTSICAPLSLSSSNSLYPTSLSTHFLAPFPHFFFSLPPPSLSPSLFPPLSFSPLTSSFPPLPHFFFSLPLFWLSLLHSFTLCPSPSPFTSSFPPLPHR